MDPFPHLKFVQKLVGKPRFFGRGGTHDKSEYNKKNRKAHSSSLSNTTSNIKAEWSTSFAKRDKENLAKLEPEIIPIFLKINPDLLGDVDFNLQKFGIEIISEENDGFIIGASLDELISLDEKINGFLTKEYGTAKIADLWEIIDGKREKWKPKYILSEELFSKWNNIQDDVLYKLEVSIAFAKPLRKKPDPTKMGGETRLEKYWKDYDERDDQLLKREEDFGKFISHYGEITSSLIHLEDSFGCEVEINGKGLKDLVFNYPYVFEVSEVEIIKGEIGENEELNFGEYKILPPDKDAPEVGVIDSGIMEEHKYLSLAIKKTESKSYVKGDSSTSDKVKGGGHGTKVAGAILYPNGLTSISSDYQLPCFIRNIRVLDDENLLSDNYPPELMKRIVEENENCKIFNLSINSRSPFRKKHMSAWAATLDTLICEKDVLFLVSTGNISKTKIGNYLSDGKSYPDYLHESFCQLSNPAQSSFAIIVGSINHSHFEDHFWESLGSDGDISAFSRIGAGIWGKIKPDVVELGGGLVKSKTGTNSIRENQMTSPELIRSTLHGGSAIAKDSTGTSFAAPKVSHIVAQLKKLYPNEGVNLLRALLVQGARLPNDHFLNPKTESLRYFGYGLPSLKRVTNNSDSRITFYNTASIKAEEGQIYSLKIPKDLRSQANEYDILIEVTLAYTSKVRRTRQRTKSYLGTWLDWSNSYLDEPIDEFKKRALKVIEGNTVEYNSGTGDLIKWKIRENKDWGDVSEFNRNNSTVQKDWAILKSFNLPEEISFAIRGHKGWDKNKEEVPFAFAVSIEVLDANIPIYESIRIENEVEITI